MLGTNSCALADKSASPDAVRMRQHSDAFIGAFVARIHVVALRERKCRRSDKYRIQANHRTSRITQRAVDAHAELLVAVQLCRGLQKFARGERRLVRMNQPRLNLLQLAEKIARVR